MPFNCADSPPLLSEGFPPSSCSAIPVLINSISALSDYLCSLNIGELEFRVAVTNVPADFLPLFGGIASDNLLVVDSDGALWYSDDTGVTWTLVAAGYCITNDTLVNILAEQTAGTLSPSCWYQVNDNVHAEGGDLLIQALDATHLSPTGYYYHAPGDIWFPMEWNPENGDMVYLKDPRWNNVAYGVLAVDEFIWTVNDTLATVPGDWSDNTFVNTLSLDFSAITASEYGIFQNNRFENSTLELAGTLTNINNNDVNQNGFLQITGLLGTTAIENNRVTGGRLILTSCEDVTASGNTLEKAVITLNTVTGTSSIINNVVTGDIANAIVAIASSVDVTYRNNVVDTSLTSLGTMDTVTFRNNHIRQNSLITFTDVDNFSFNNNDVTDCDIDVDTSDGGIVTENTFNYSTIDFDVLGGTVDNNTFVSSLITINDIVASGVVGNNALSRGTLTLNNINDDCSFFGNIVNNGAISATNVITTIIDSNEVNSNGSVSAAAVTGGAIVQIIQNSVENSGAVAITNITDSTVTCSYNKILQGSQVSIALIDTAIEVLRNTLLAESIISVLTADEIYIRSNTLEHDSTLEVTDAGGGGVVSFNALRGVSSLLINSSSFTGLVDVNDIAANSFLRFAAHAGQARYNRLFASDVTATKNIANVCNINLWFDTTTVLGAGVDTVNSNNND